MLEIFTIMIFEGLLVFLLFEKNQRGYEVF